MRRSIAVSGLTENEEHFCIEFAKSSNATAAYKSAWINSKAKPENINVMASRLLAQVKIKSRIAELRQATVKQTNMDLERWAQEVTRLSTSDARKFMHEDGRMKMPNELDDDTAAAVASFKFDVDGTVEYKFHPKNPALDMMAKHQGAYEKDNEQRGGPLNGLSRDVLKAMVERLRILNNGGH